MPWMFATSTPVSRERSPRRGPRASATRIEDESSQFDAYHLLWKAYRTLGDEGRARRALEKAAMHADFVEIRSPEVDEVRAALLQSGASKSL